MTTLRISERTSMEDVLAWNLPACDVIRVSKRSSFEPGAQGLAVACLASLKPRTKGPVLVCEFEEPQTDATFEETIFASGFGTALSRLVRGIEFQGGASSDVFKVLLAEVYKAKEGKGNLQADVGRNQRQERLFNKRVLPRKSSKSANRSMTV